MRIPAGWLTYCTLYCSRVEEFAWFPQGLLSSALHVLAHCFHIKTLKQTQHSPTPCMLLTMVAWLLFEYSDVLPHPVLFHHLYLYIGYPSNLLLASLFVYAFLQLFPLISSYRKYLQYHNYWPTVGKIAHYCFNGCKLLATFVHGRCIINVSSIRFMITIQRATM